MLAALAAGLKAQAQATLADALHALAMQSPDRCEAVRADDVSQHPESAVFKAVADLVTARLNGSAGTPKQRAQAALTEAMLEATTAQAAWPEDARFQGKVVLDAPALVVTMFAGTQGRWFAFGAVAGRWTQVGEDDGEFDNSPRRLMQVYRLRSGAAGVSRFLAARTFFGCAGSSGISYEVYEWDSRQPNGPVSEVLKQDGAFGMDEAADGRGPTVKDPFWPIGNLVTDGPVLKLPYCIFTGIDTWDNPSLCALDRYDVRGATIRFLSRAYNRPELVPIAKAMGYAAEHDLPATRAYCASEELARRLVFGGVPGPDANVEVVRHGRGKRIWFGDHESWFDVEQRQGRWIIVGLSKAQ